MSIKPYFILSGGYDTKNVGDYAMLDFLQRKFKEDKNDIKLLVRHEQKHLKDYYGVSELIKNYEYNNKKESEGRFFRGFNNDEDDTHLIDLKEKLENSKGLIIGGGRLLIDYTMDVMRGPLPYFATLVTLCKFLRVPVYIYAMTIVPCKTEEGNKWLRYIVDNCKKVSVRDEGSLNLLRSIGCINNEIDIIPDPAFGLQWKIKLLQSKTKLKAGLTVRAIDETWGGISSDNYIKKMTNIIKLLQDNNIDIIGIPHQFYGIDNKQYDDRTILKEISKHIDFEFIEDEILDLREYQKIYETLDILVGIRRHSFIYAAMSGVPVLPFSENPNASRACNDIGIEDKDILGLSENYDNHKRKLENFLSTLQERQTIQNQKIEYQKNKLEHTYGKWIKFN